VDIVTRAAVRVICLDRDSRVLLLHWRDPFDGNRLWEPPGGGIEPGESPVDSARRELVEETGLDPHPIAEHFRLVQRDVIWDGRRVVGPESFFVARFDAVRPVLSPQGLLAYEMANLLGTAWVGPDEIGGLPDRVEPPELAAVIAELAPDSAWATSR
jgi:8-oxo-dGTP pyrophosphatase MutT (NUDIX family)